jgi:hypothetical protein
MAAGPPAGVSCARTPDVTRARQNMNARMPAKPPRPVARLSMRRMGLPSGQAYGDRPRLVLDPAADPSLFPPSGSPVRHLKRTGDAGFACSLAFATPLSRSEFRVRQPVEGARGPAAADETSRGLGSSAVQGRDVPLIRRTVSRRDRQQDQYRHASRLRPRHGQARRRGLSTNEETTLGTDPHRFAASQATSSLP